jgi:hypothetical protein
MHLSYFAGKAFPGDSIFLLSFSSSLLLSSNLPMELGVGGSHLKL